MIEYTAGLLFGDTSTDVALIRKKRPSWQKGRWNAIGGHIEVDENPLEAQYREFKEETGVKVPSWEAFAVLSGSAFRVHFFRAFSTGLLRSISTMTDEVVERFHLCDLPTTILPNLRWLIPMALSMDLDSTDIFYIDGGT